MITCAVSAARASARPTAFAVSPPMPASSSSKTSVSPPATTAIASAMRESSPPDAVCATGESGRPGFGRIRNSTSSAPVGPGSRSVSARLELAVAEAEARELGGDRLGEARRRLGAQVVQTLASSATRASAV